MTSQPLAAGALQTGRWELIRALAAVVDARPDESGQIVRVLDLPALEPAEHTATFVLWCPPYAALHLGPEGKLGGTGADRVAGFWRALGLTPPSEPDHLSQLLMLYAHLGSAEQESDRALMKFMDDEGHTNLTHPNSQAWTPSQALSVLNWLTAMTIKPVP